MADKGDQNRDGNRGRGSSMGHVFPRLTLKQHEVLRFVAENRTSKEIAWELGISESAVNQRIEGVRTRAGAPPRAELARAYRQYLHDQELACNPIPDKIPQLPESGADGTVRARDERGGQFALSDSVMYTFTAPWQREGFERVVPEVLDGADAAMNRFVFMIAIAGGTLLMAMIGIGVVHALSDLI